MSAAADQLDEIIDYVEQFNPDAADQLGADLRTLAANLSYSPRRGRPVRGGTRELVSVRPYVIRYRVSADGETVSILSVRHTSRKPL